METSKFQIVVARYNENLDWLLPYSDISIIYNKGNKNISKVFNVINLPNYGRESHTYLYHIINNYDNLANKTIFFQGNIDDHKTLQIKDYFDNNDFTGKINTPDMAILKEPVKHFGKWKDEKTSGAMRSCNYIPIDWITNIIGTEMDIKQKKFNTVWCAIFSISKELILKKPKIFYENILRYVDYHPNPEEGHLLERAWYSIFNNNYTPKKIIGYCNMNSYRVPEDFDTTLEKYQKMCDYHNLEELHLWFYVIPNYDLGKYLKINNIPVCGKYFSINPYIENGNIFHLNVKADNNMNVLINFVNINPLSKNENSYEFIFGNKCIIFDKKNKNIIAAYDKPIFDKNKFVKLQFDFSENGIIKVYADDKTIFNKNINIALGIISEIKIKNNSEHDIFLDYNCRSDEGANDSRKLKIFLENNYYDIGKNFYYKYYNEYYVSKFIL